MHHRVKVTRNLLTKLTSWWQSWVERLPLPFTWNSLSEITMQIYSFSKTQRYCILYFFINEPKSCYALCEHLLNVSVLGHNIFTVFWSMKVNFKLSFTVHMKAVLFKQLFCPSSNSKCILKNVYSAVKKYGLHWFCD